jgi:hypothetical protein
MTTLAVKDRVCVQGKGSTVYVIQRFRTELQAECIEQGEKGPSRFFAVDKLTVPTPEPRKWKRVGKGAGNCQYESSDGWLVFKSSGGHVAQLGKIVSPSMKLKRDVYAWVEGYKKVEEGIVA